MKLFRYAYAFYKNSFSLTRISNQGSIKDRYYLQKNESLRDYFTISELSSWFLWLRPIVFVKKNFVNLQFCFYLLLFSAQ